MLCHVLCHRAGKVAGGLAGLAAATAFRVALAGRPRGVSGGLGAGTVWPPPAADHKKPIIYSINGEKSAKGVNIKKALRFSRSPMAVLMSGSA